MFDLSEVDGKLNEVVVVFYFWNKAFERRCLVRKKKELGGELSQPP